MSFVNRAFGKRPITVCIDLDGTILFAEDGQKELGKPISGNTEYMHQMKALGWNIIIHTARLGAADEGLWKTEPEEIAQHLRANNIPFDGITAEKPKKGVAYIDDRMVGGYIKKNQTWPADIIDQVRLLSDQAPEVKKEMEAAKATKEKENYEENLRTREQFSSMRKTLMLMRLGKSQLELGQDVETEHDETVTKALDKTEKGKRPSLKEVETGIAKDHLKEHDKYYQETDGVSKDVLFVPKDGSTVNPLVIWRVSGVYLFKAAGTTPVNILYQIYKKKVNSGYPGAAEAAEMVAKDFVTKKITIDAAFKQMNAIFTPDPKGFQGMEDENINVRQQQLEAGRDNE